MIKPLEPWPKPPQSKEEHAKENQALLQAYQNGKDIIEFGHVLTKLNKGVFKNGFKGGFKEQGDFLHGHFVIKHSSLTSSYYEFEHFEIHIHSSGLLEYCNYNSLKEVGEFWPFSDSKKSFDQTGALLDFMAWARKVNSDFDSQFDALFHQQKKDATKVSVTLLSKDFDNLEDLTKLVGEFKKAGRLHYVNQHKAKDKVTISAYTKNGKNLTQKEAKQFTQLGAMVITSGSL